MDHRYGRQKKSSRMKEQLNAARKRIAQLENQIDILKGESTTVEQNLDTQKKEINNMVSGVNGQLQGMIDKLNKKVDGISGDAQEIAEIKAMIESLEQQKVSLDAINEKADSVKDELIERIHTENVACYRNMKSLVTELHENVNDMELSEDSLTQIRKSFKGLKFFSVFALLSFVVLLFFLLVALGVIPL